MAFIRQVHPSLETAHQLVQAFVKMVREQKASDLEYWLEHVRNNHVPELTISLLKKYRSLALVSLLADSPATLPHQPKL
ncbi:hypothetical protein EPA93_01380 [Ktedonosporobacter rubrisoli]|uniref:Uncharacterized protein n=1 Tax=Ktedonosporobacter rubrisoli TaxID=2509675 RepID=A0A4P6JIH4_KTERU|nr:hypothetical protein [Ktedonosporobacter rubrisoli]QBD74712.1 hypothetical protein EPA93_01380 [Ktedonosporobacter rubrisoli]